MFFDLCSIEKDHSAVQDDTGTINIIFRSLLNSVNVALNELYDLNTSVESCVMFILIFLD
jgi:hypothetical protein